MATERFRPDVERTRWHAGLLFMTLGAAAVAYMAWRVSEVGRVTATTVVFLVVPALLAAWGAYLAFRPPVVLDVEVEQRTYAVIRNGQLSATGPLDDLDPLVVSRRTQRVAGNAKRRQIVYVVHASKHAKIELFVASSAGRARRKMETLGRAWHLGCQSYGGEVRGRDDLDKPLHERVRKGAAPVAPAALRAEWGVRLEPLSSGYALVSNYRSWTPLFFGTIFLLAGLLAAGFGRRTGIMYVLHEMGGGDLVTQVLGSLMLVVVFVILWKFARGVQDTFFPGSVRITERGVAYRGRRMKLAQIEEVTSGVPIEIVGDRRMLSLAASFCPPQATEAVAYEIQRLILSMAPRAS